MKFQVLTILLASLMLLASPAAFAGEDDAGALKKHIAVLLHESRALKAEGRHDAADILWRRALELRARLAERSQGEKRVPLTMDQARKVLHGLEMGMEALKSLHREKELKALAKVANGIRERMQKAQAAQRERPRDEHPEILEAKRQLAILRAAFHGLREGEKREAMERMEHAIHALELGIEGRRDEEAQNIRKSAPNREERIELLRLAAKLWDGFGHEGKAKSIRELAEKMAAQTRRRTDRKQHESRERGLERREIAERRMKVMRHALVAFREAEKPRLVEQVELLLHAYELLLGGREGEDVRAAWKKAPDNEQQAELMGYAARLYAEWGHEDRAHALKALSKELLGNRTDRRQEAHEQRERGDQREHSESMEHLEMLHHQLHELRTLVERLEKKMQAFEHRLAEERD